MVPDDGDSEWIDEMVKILANEKIPAVRSAAVSSLLRLPPIETANSAIQNMLSTQQERDANVRARMVKYLIERMKEYPGNRVTLQAQLKRETNREIIVAILNALVK